MSRAVLVGLLALAAPARARADDTQCRLLEVELLPAAHETNDVGPQIAVWVEDPAGNFVDTVFLTQATGTFGIGNRPGRFDFNSGPLWPYGRRVTTFPVWSTKQPLRWPSLVFKDAKDDNLSHAVKDSSRDPHYCRPVKPVEFDAMSCPTDKVLTDKGVLVDDGTSRYPPREDVVAVSDIDHPSVEMQAALNPFDAISQPTPPLGEQALLSYAVSPELPSGEYVLWLEVSKEFDTNDSYNEQTFPPPQVSFSDYGLPYRGQPSVVWRVPFTLSGDTTQSTVTDYFGYGDPDGIDGNIRPADGTITSGVQGSGASRLGLISRGDTTHRVRVVSRRELDREAPDHPRRLRVDPASTTATIRFIAPGDDYQDGVVKGYDVRYRVDAPVTEDNFESSTVVTTSLSIADARTEQAITIEGLLPETHYYIGIRAFDNCRNTSTLSTVELDTTERIAGDVDACFIATAAYGSKLAHDVEKLRSFRDRLLGKTVFGELAIEVYYTFGPAFAQLIGSSELLRATAREALEPFVDAVR